MKKNVENHGDMLQNGLKLSYIMEKMFVNLWKCSENFTKVGKKRKNDEKCVKIGLNYEKNLWKKSRKILVNWAKFFDENR